MSEEFKDEEVLSLSYVAKNPFDTSQVGELFKKPEVDNSIEIYRMSGFTEYLKLQGSSQGSLELNPASSTKSDQPFKKKNKPSVVVKSVNQNYTGLLRGITRESKDSSHSFKTISDLSFRSSKNEQPSRHVYEEPKESPLVTTDSKLQYSFSSCNTEKHLPAKTNSTRIESNLEEAELVLTEPKSPRFQFERSVQASVSRSALGIVPRTYCKYCQTETSTDVTYQLQKMSFWKSVQFFLSTMRCCGNPSSLNAYQEATHICKKCHNVVARVKGI